MYHELRKRGTSAPKVELPRRQMRYFQPGRRNRSVKDVSFSVNAGESIAIIGQSGCARATLLSLISGIIEPTAGAVLLRRQARVGPSARSATCCSRTIFSNGAPFWKMSC